MVGCAAVAAVRGEAQADGGAGHVADVRRVGVAGDGVAPGGGGSDEVVVELVVHDVARLPCVAGEGEDCQLDVAGELLEAVEAPGNFRAPSAVAVGADGLEVGGAAGGRAREVTQEVGLALLVRGGDLEALVVAGAVLAASEVLFEARGADGVGCRVGGPLPGMVFTPSERERVGGVPGADVLVQVVAGALAAPPEHADARGRAGVGGGAGAGEDGAAGDGELFVGFSHGPGDVEGRVDLLVAGAVVGGEGGERAQLDARPLGRAGCVAGEEGSDDAARLAPGERRRGVGGVEGGRRRRGGRRAEAEDGRRW